MADLDIQFITHATLKIRGAFGTLLCDPWFLNEPVFNLSTWKFPAAVVPPQEVASGVDYLLITHSHEDHFHIPSIDYIDRNVKVLLPAYDDHPSMRAHTTERTLRALGFHDIRRIRSWSSVKLGGVTPLTIVPSAASRDQDWENCGFVIQHPDCTILNINDNVNDEALCRDIKARFPVIDLAMIQSGGVTMFPGCFRMSEAAMREAAQQRKLAFREQRRLLEFVQPKRIAPFAGDFCWLDDKHFHNNWANRTTPKLFSEMVQNDFGDRGVDLVVLHPGDHWSMRTGVRRSHPPIDWDDMLSEVRKVKARFQPKIDAINAWLQDVNLRNLEARSRQRTALVERWITRDYIDFTSRFRIVVEGDRAGFGFVMKADPEAGFHIDWDDKDEVEQTLFVPQHVWAAILDGKLMWNIVQWVGQAEQRKFTRDMGRFWYWIEYHVDLNSKNIQAVIEPRLLPELREHIRPHYGVFPMEGEWSDVKRAAE